MRSGAARRTQTAAPPRPGRRRSTKRQKSIVPGSTDPAQPGPRPPHRRVHRPAGAAASSRSSSSVMPRPAAAACRAPRRPRRRPAPRDRPGRRASRRPAAPGRSRGPTARRAPAPARPAAATPRGTAQRSRSSRPGHLAVHRQPGAGQPLRPRRPGRPRTRRGDRRPWSPAASSPSSQAARVTGGQVDPQVDPVEQRPGQPATGSAGAPAGCTCRRCRRPRVAHGQGLAASTSWARQGNVADPAARWIVTEPRSSGCRSVSSTARGNSGASSRNSTPRCARHSAPGPDLPRAAADQRRHRGRVVRRLERAAAGPAAPRAAACRRPSGSR